MKRCAASPSPHWVGHAGLLVGLGLQGLHVEEPRPGRRRRCSAFGRACPPAAPRRAGPGRPGPRRRRPRDRRAQQSQPGCRHLERFQADLARALAGKPGIASGVWLTRQTLAINRTGELDAVWPLVCEEVLHYPALRNVRIQLNARPGVDEPVRWRQCATY
jgi:hypothetical protein